jgi:hypothetical protein
VDLAMFELFFMQHIVKITVVGLGFAVAGLWSTKQSKKKTELELITERMAEIEERIKNRGF